MIPFIAGRLGGSLAVLLVMSFVIYGLIGLMPGDPIDEMIAANPDLTSADVARLKALHGLDQPLLERYGNWLAAAAGGDFGYSRIHAKPVLDVLLPHLWNTTLLMTLVIVLSLAIIVFSISLEWLPAGGMETVGDGGFLDRASYMVLPVLVLTLNTVGGYTRFIRASMIQTLRQDFIRTARAKGMSEVRLLLGHALRNALLPLVTVVALSFGSLFSGALITETMFAWLGIGKMIFDSVLGNDFNLALVGLLFATLMTLLGNILADAAYTWIDPRISLDAGVKAR
ncbi:MAG: ABC transporter permease [Magnetovibrio sp.]|nr:ABC transporter permease [Magnetovibrio sp.]